jgi:thiol-disulfide isomerase/thioredoxin
MLFYKASCPYCTDFMPIWYKIVNNLSNTVMYEEIECEKDYKKANEYQITSVPTIILLVNNEKKMYMGDRNYSDIMKFLKYNGVNLVERTFEEFNSTGYSVPVVPSSNKNTSLCPNVTFNSELDVSQDNYIFQIFNENGQYGYASGGNNSDKIMSPFTAAYSTIDSYLTSLPQGANINECASMYADQIRSFGLCDKKQLDNILQYQKNIEQGSATTLINGTDYSSNNDVITAIKNVCDL